MTEKPTVKKGAMTNKPASLGLKILSIPQVVRNLDPEAVDEPVDNSKQDDLSKKPSLGGFHIDLTVVGPKIPKNNVHLEKPPNTQGQTKPVCRIFSDILPDMIRPT